METEEILAELDNVETQIQDVQGLFHLDFLKLTLIFYNACLAFRLQFFFSF